MMKFKSQNSSEIYIIPLILLHAARLMIWLVGVRPAVNLTWKALQCTAWAPGFVDVCFGVFAIESLSVVMHTPIVQTQVDFQRRVDIDS